MTLHYFLVPVSSPFWTFFPTYYSQEPNLSYFILQFSSKVLVFFNFFLTFLLFIDLPKHPYNWSFKLFLIFVKMRPKLDFCIYLICFSYLLLILFLCHVLWLSTDDMIGICSVKHTCILSINIKGMILFLHFFSLFMIRI